MRRQRDIYKEQLDKELKEKITVTDKYAKLEKEYGTLLQQVNDMGVVCINIDQFIDLNDRN